MRSVSRSVTAFSSSPSGAFFGGAVSLSRRRMTVFDETGLSFMGKGWKSVNIGAGANDARPCPQAVGGALVQRVLVSGKGSLQATRRVQRTHDDFYDASHA